MPPAAAPHESLCLCGHDLEAHEHYRRGTECSHCDCQRFRPAR